MHIIALMLVTLAMAGQDSEATRVETTFDKTTDFSAFRTYDWTTGSPAQDPAAHKAIVAAVDAEMASLGFSRVTTSPDVTITYHTVASTVVDLEALDKLERQGGGGPTPTRTRARLVVTMRNPATTRQVWTASAREYLEPDPSKLPDTARSVAARLFETYPGRKTTR